MCCFYILIESKVQNIYSEDDLGFDNCLKVFLSQFNQSTVIFYCFLYSACNLKCTFFIIHSFTYFTSLRFIAFIKERKHSKEMFLET